MDLIVGEPLRSGITTFRAEEESNRAVFHGQKRAEPSINRQSSPEAASMSRTKKRLPPCFSSFPFQLGLVVRGGFVEQAEHSAVVVVAEVVHDGRDQYEASQPGAVHGGGFKLRGQL